MYCLVFLYGHSKCAVNVLWLWLCCDGSARSRAAPMVNEMIIKLKRSVFGTRIPSLICICMNVESQASIGLYGSRDYEFAELHAKSILIWNINWFLQRISVVRVADKSAVFKCQTYYYSLVATSGFVGPMVLGIPMVISSIQTSFFFVIHARLNTSQKQKKMVLQMVPQQIKIRCMYV